MNHKPNRRRGVSGGPPFRYSDAPGGALKKEGPPLRFWSSAGTRYSGPLRRQAGFQIP